MNAEENIPKPFAKRKAVRRPTAKKVKTAALSSRKKAVPRPPIWERIAELGQKILPEERAKPFSDGSINYRHYLYGTPKVSSGE